MSQHVGLVGRETRLARRLRKVGGNVVEQQDERVLAGGQAARPPMEEVAPVEDEPFAHRGGEVRLGVGSAVGGRRRDEAERPARR